MSKYESLIEAVQWSGSNWHEMLAFASGDVVATDGSQLFADIGDVTVTVHEGSWVLRDKRGKFSVMDDEEFSSIYIEVDESELV